MKPFFSSFFCTLFTYCFCWIGNFCFAQNAANFEINPKLETQIRIKGNVSASSNFSKNEPLFGATIVVQELNKYAQSDADGNFLVEFLLHLFLLNLHIL